MTKELGIGVKKEENFSEWYTQVIQKAELADYSLVSGCMIFRPYSYAMWEILQKAVDERLKKMGVQNAYFPLFIPENLFKKEQEHVEGFSPEVAWVTQAGEKELDERLAVRPTSETIMYESYSKWIRSWRDLPLKINQWNNVVRWEFKHPVALLRTREFLWNEGHTVYATREEAEKERELIIGMYRDILKEYMALHGLIGKKTEKEKFAGAVYTVSIEFLLPNGRVVQGPDFHFDGQNFAKAFDIKFLNKDGKMEYAWQNTWAITTRMLGVMIAVHGDDKGLVLPPKIAPIQIVIVPIIYEGTKEKVLEKANEIKELLSEYRIKLDDREEHTPGWKFNEWELKGVPIRIEIGPKDVEQNEVVVVRRDTLEKMKIGFDVLKEKISEILEKMQNDMYEKSKKFIEENIVEVKSWDEFIKYAKEGKILFAPFCGVPECEEEIKEKSGGITTRCIPFKQPKFEGNCINCNRKAKFMCYFAKTY